MQNVLPLLTQMKLVGRFFIMLIMVFGTSSRTMAQSETPAKNAMGIGYRITGYEPGVLNFLLINYSRETPKTSIAYIIPTLSIMTGLGNLDWGSPAYPGTSLEGVIGGLAGFNLGIQGSVLGISLCNQIGYGFVGLQQGYIFSSLLLRSGPKLKKLQFELGIPIPSGLSLGPGDYFGFTFANLSVAYKF